MRRGRNQDRLIYTVVREIFGSIKSQACRPAAGMLFIIIKIKIRSENVRLTPAEAASGDIFLESPVINERISSVGGTRCCVQGHGLMPDFSGLVKSFLGNQHI